MLYFIIMQNLAQCKQLEVPVDKEKPGGIAKKIFEPTFLKMASIVL